MPPSDVRALGHEKISPEEDKAIDENTFIAHEIRHSGFPLEIEVTSILEAAGWSVFPSHFYLDYDDEKYKELDILASKTYSSHLKDAAPNFILVLELLIQCKKRGGNAWVFFPRTTDPAMVFTKMTRMDTLLVSRLCSYSKTPKEAFFPRMPKRIWSELTERIVLSDVVANQIYGRDVSQGDFRYLSAGQRSLSFEVSKLPNVKLPSEGGKWKESERHKIQAALQGLAKAAIHRQVQMSALIQSTLDSVVAEAFASPLFFFYFFPIVIFDGKLKIWKDGLIQNARDVLHEVALYSAEYTERKLIDVLTRDTFKDWLSGFEEDAADFEREIAGLQGEANLLLTSLKGEKSWAENVPRRV